MNEENIIQIVVLYSSYLPLVILTLFLTNTLNYYIITHNFKHFVFYTPR